MHPHWRGRQPGQSPHLSRSAQEWFHKNRMHRYNDRQDLSGDLITGDLANALAMSCSRHRAFDAGLFVFAPKRGTWVAHFMEVTAHYGSQHHNRPVKLPQNVAPQFLLARFAWTLFPHIKNFLEAGAPRLVRFQSKDPVSGRFKEEDRLLGREAINKILQAGRGRSASPRKRFAPNPDPELEQRDAVYADLRHRKRPRNTADSIGSDAHLTQQPDTPQSPAIDSVHSTRVAKLQAPPPHHDLLCRRIYCQMRLWMVDNRLPAPKKSKSKAASLISELRPFATLALPTES